MRQLPYDDLGNPNLRSPARYLLWTARQQWQPLLVGTAYGIAWMGAQALVPAAIGRGLDQGVSDHDMGAAWKWSGIVLALAAIQAVAGVLRHRVSVANWLYASFRSMQLLGRHSAEVGVAIRGRLPTGEVVSAATNDALMIGGAFDVSARLAGALVSYLIVATLLLTTNVVIGTVVLVGVPVMIVLLGLELVTGSFALLPLARLEGRATWNAIIANWWWVFLANLLGSIVFGGLLAITLTNMGTAAPTGLAARIIAVAEAKTVANEALGFAGMVSVFVKGILCNWLVCLGVVMAMTSTSTVGKIVATWLPIFTFFALGFEHTVVNMFIIPTGMMLGAKVSVYEWWVWNQIPVTLGNLVGGFVFTGLALYSTFRPANAPVLAPLPVAAHVPAE